MGEPIAHNSAHVNNYLELFLHHFYEPAGATRTSFDGNRIQDIKLRSELKSGKTRKRRWFTTGLDEGLVAACNTFGTQQ
jgi:hypothetical protein